MAEAKAREEALARQAKESKEEALAKQRRDQQRAQEEVILKRQNQRERERERQKEEIEQLKKDKIELDRRSTERER